MSDSSLRLADLLAAFTAARSRAETDTAASALYVATLPPFTRICVGVLQRAPVALWQSADDLAEDTLVDALPALQRGACPDASKHGLLRWLAAAASRRLITAARRQQGVTEDDVANVLSGTHASNAAVPGCLVHTDAAEDSRAARHVAFHTAYEAALTALPPRLCTTWRLVVEGQSPQIDAAAELGMHRCTVRRRVEETRTHLAVHLDEFIPQPVPRHRHERS